MLMLEQRIQQQFFDSADLQYQCAETVSRQVAEAAATLLAALTGGGKVLVCGSGVGMSIAVNRHSAVRAVVCSEPYSARLARQHNDANVLCLGARVIGSGTAKDIDDAFFGMSFEGGRHAARVAKINP